MAAMGGRFGEGRTLLAGQRSTAGQVRGGFWGSVPASSLAVARRSWCWGPRGAAPSTSRANHSTSRSTDDSCISD